MRKGRRYVYRLIEAHDTMQFLLGEGVPEQDLPASERLLREIRKLDETQQVPVWKAVMRVKREQGREPTIHDVQAEAVKVTQSDGAIERQQKELLGNLEGVARSLKVGVSFEVLTPEYRRRLSEDALRYRRQGSSAASGVSIRRPQTPEERQGREVQSPEGTGELQENARPTSKKTAKKQSPQEQAEDLRREIAAHHREKLPGPEPQAFGARTDV